MKGLDVDAATTVCANNLLVFSGSIKLFVFNVLTRLFPLLSTCSGWIKWDCNPNSDDSSALLVLLLIPDNDSKGSWMIYRLLGFADTQRLFACFVVKCAWLDDGIADTEEVTSVVFKLAGGITVVVLELSGYWVLRSMVKALRDCDGGEW